MSGVQPQVQASSQLAGSRRGPPLPRERSAGGVLAQLAPSGGYPGQKTRVHEAAKARANSPPASRQQRNTELGMAASRKQVERPQVQDEHRGISSEIEKDIFGDYAGSGTPGSSVGPANASQKQREKAPIEFEPLPHEDESTQDATTQEVLLVEKIETFCAYQDNLLDGILEEIDGLHAKRDKIEVSIKELGARLEKETTWIQQHQDGQHQEVLIVPAERVNVPIETPAELGGMKDERDVSELLRDLAEARKALNAKMVELQNLQQSLKEQKGSKSELELELEELNMVSNLYEEVSDRLEFEIHEMLEKQRILHADLMGLDKVITMAVRIRPESGATDPAVPITAQVTSPSSSIVEIGSANKLSVKNSELPQQSAKKEVSRSEYEFDRIYPVGSGDEEIFDDVRPLVRYALEGHPVIISMFGQSNSGKSYLLFGNGTTSNGVIGKSIDSIYERIEELEQAGWKAEVSYQILEFSNDNVTNLTGPVDVGTSILRPAESKESLLSTMLSVGRDQKRAKAGVFKAKQYQIFLLMTRDALPNHPSRTEVTGSINFIELPPGNKPANQLQPSAQAEYEGAIKILKEFGETIAKFGATLLQTTNSGSKSSNFTLGVPYDAPPAIPLALGLEHTNRLLMNLSGLLTKQTRVFVLFNIAGDDQATRRLCAFANELRLMVKPQPPAPLMQTEQVPFGSQGVFQGSQQFPMQRGGMMGPNTPQTFSGTPNGSGRQDGGFFDDTRGRRFDNGGAQFGGYNNNFGSDGKQVPGSFRPKRDDFNNQGSESDQMPRMGYLQNQGFSDRGGAPRGRGGRFGGMNASPGPRRGGYGSGFSGYHDEQSKAQQYADIMDLEDTSPPKSTPPGKDGSNQPGTPMRGSASRNPEGGYGYQSNFSQSPSRGFGGQSRGSSQNVGSGMRGNTSNGFSTPRGGQRGNPGFDSSPSNNRMNQEPIPSQQFGQSQMGPGPQGYHRQMNQGPSGMQNQFAVPDGGQGQQGQRPFSRGGGNKGPPNERSNQPSGGPGSFNPSGPNRRGGAGGNQPPFGQGFDSSAQGQSGRPGGPAWNGPPQGNFNPSGRFGGGQPSSGFQGGPNRGGGFPNQRGGSFAGQPGGYQSRGRGFQR